MSEKKNEKKVTRLRLKLKVWIGFLNQLKVILIHVTVDHDQKTEGLRVSNLFTAWIRWMEMIKDIYNLFVKSVWV